MRVFYFVFILCICSSVWTAEKVDRDYEKDLLNRVIPRFKFSGTIEEVLYQLREETTSNNPYKPSLNVVYYPKTVEDTLDGLVLAEELAVEKPLTVSFDLENLTVIEILKHLCDLYNLRYQIEDKIVSIVHPNEVTENLQTKFYSLSLSDMKNFENGGAQKFLESQGVAFNRGSSAKYISSINKVIVINSESEQVKTEDCFFKFEINQRLIRIERELESKDISPKELSLIKKRLRDVSDYFYEQTRETPVEIRSAKIEKKLDIIIPKVRFIDRDVEFIADFIKRTTRDLDEEGEGLNIILGPEVLSTKLRVNLDLDDVSVLNVIKFSCHQLGFSYKFDNSAVIIVQKIKNPYEAQRYEISPYFLKFVQKQYQNDFKKSLESLGVKFRLGASVSYVEKVQWLTISNSKGEHKKLKEIFEFFNK